MSRILPLFFIGFDERREVSFAHIFTQYPIYWRHFWNILSAKKQKLLKILYETPKKYFVEDNRASKQDAKLFVPINAKC